MITVSPSDGRWHGNWNSEYVVSLKQLRLADLIEDDDHLHQHNNKDAQVSINLSIQKVWLLLFGPFLFFSSICSKFITAGHLSILGANAY